jgi:hypothetical protein
MDIRTVEYRWTDDADHTYWADVVVGDGTVVFDDKYDAYDARIFFYFEDDEEFQNYFEGGSSVDEFVILRVED